LYIDADWQHGQHELFLGQSDKPKSGLNRTADAPPLGSTERWSADSRRGTLRPMTIVVYTHRPKRPPPKKQKASALARAAKAAAATKAPPTIVKPTSEKQLRRLRQERAQQPASEPSPEVEAFFARNVRPGGALPPLPGGASGRPSHRPVDLPPSLLPRG
jgi:hypothetical protein